MSVFSGVTLLDEGNGKYSLDVDDNGMAILTALGQAIGGKVLSEGVPITLTSDELSLFKDFGVTVSKSDSPSLERRVNSGAQEVNIKTSFVRSDVVTKGNTSIDLLVKGGRANGSTFSGESGNDSIQFRGASLKNTKVYLGKGSDTVTFKNSEFAKRTTVDLGAQKNAKADLVKIDKPVEGGKIVIENFDKKDTLKLDGKKYSYDDLTSKPSPTLDNIKIKFDD